MKKYDVKRVAVVTSIGAGDSKDQVRCCVCERTMLLRVPQHLGHRLA